MAPWVDLFVQYLEAPLPIELTTLTENSQQIDMMNNHPEWKLRGTLA
jgi:hypothetical protein